MLLILTIKNSLCVRAVGKTKGKFSKQKGEGGAQTGRWGKNILPSMRKGGGEKERICQPWMLTLKTAVSLRGKRKRAQNPHIEILFPDSFMSGRKKKKIVGF